MRDYLKNYKVKNPRALKLGLMTTGLSLMKGAGQTYDRPVSTTGLMGGAGLQGLGTYETARAADIASTQKGVEEATKERRHIERIKASKYISEAEIGARESLAKHKTGKATELSKADIAARKSLEEYKAGQAKTRAEWEHGPEGWRRIQSEQLYGEGGLKEQEIKAGKETGLTVSQATNLNKAAYEHTDKFIEGLKDSITGKIMNPITDLPMSDKAIQELRKMKMSAYLNFAMGEKKTSAMEASTVPPAPSFESKYFPRTDTSEGLRRYQIRR
jgi:hypothetical protein